MYMKKYIYMYIYIYGYGVWGHRLENCNLGGEERVSPMGDGGSVIMHISPRIHEDTAVGGPLGALGDLWGSLGDPRGSGGTRGLRRVPKGSRRSQ